MKNREIKFRAYYKMYKGIYPVAEIILDEESVMLITTDEHDGELDMITCGYEDIEIMQYTGIKDKNGVDIYEGDVIEDTDYEGMKITGSIVYRLGAFYIDWNTYPHSLLGIGTPTIVGNIYENKELL